MCGKSTQNKKLLIVKIGIVPSVIAEYLNLANAELYMGQCFSLSSATLLEGAI